MQPKPTPEMLRQWDRRHVWHPFTQMSDYVAENVPIIVAGEGVRLIDAEGRRYYDGVSSLWLNVLGHRAPALDDAIRDQLDRIAHSTLLGLGSESSARLARRLAEISPKGLDRVFFSDSGATAVEIAMKMAIQFWYNEDPSTNRRQFVAFQNGYHGDTFGPMSLVADDLFHAPFRSMLMPNLQVPFPHAGGTSLDQSMQMLDAALRTHSGKIAGVVTEPVQGAGGMIAPPGGFLRALRKICDRHEVFLIVDEVATGFGRTGALFACDHESVTPDILCLGKGITGGYLPLAATLATDEIYEAFLAPYGERRQLFHGHSYTGNALACAVALATLDALEELMPTLPTKIEAIATGLARLREEEFVGEIRQAGTMCAVELVSSKDPHESFAWEFQAGKQLCDLARELGMILRPLGSNVIFMPPLASSVEEIGAMLDILNEAYARFARQAAARA